MKRVLPSLVFAVALALCWPRLQPLPQPAFVVTNPVNLSPHRAVAPPLAVPPQGELLPDAGIVEHAVNLSLRSDGKLIAVWFAGTVEGASDVAIYSSVYDQGIWSKPQVVITRTQVAEDTQRLIRKLGNPLLWRDAQNVLHLWFVSVSYGGWAGSAINHIQSGDDGLHWSAATRIVTSPFLNISTLIRNPPLALVDGGIALPAYHEFLGKRPEWLRFDNQLHLIDKARVPQSDRALQPAAVALDAHRVIALMRNTRPLRRIDATSSDDGGDHWQPVSATSLPNPDAAIALLRLADGSLLLACNPLESNRNQLALLRSRDEGRSWSAPWIVEQSKSERVEFSYPALLQDGAGSVHLAYTWKRESIKHVMFTPAQIEALQ